MRKKKWLRVTGISVLVVALLTLAAHLFVVYRAKQILRFIVEQASQGQYTVNSEKVQLRYFPLSIRAKSIALLPTDSSATNTYYETHADSLYIQVSKIWALVNRRNLSLENVHIINPVIKVFDNDTALATQQPLHLAVNDIQRALVNTLTDFSIRNCRIDNGSISYAKNKSGIRPLLINHVWLRIEDLHAERIPEISDSTISFQAHIAVDIKKPTIVLPDPDTDIFIDNLSLDTRLNRFKVDSLDVYAKNDHGSVDSISLSNVSLKNFNWNRWLKEGLIEIDSVRAAGGNTFLDFSETNVFKAGAANAQNKKQLRYANLLLHHIEISTIRYALRLRSNTGPFNTQLYGDSLGMKEVSLSNNSDRPLKVGGVAFKLSHFSNEYDSRKNGSTFDRLLIDQNSLVLVNYKRALNFKNIDEGSSITIPMLRLQNFSLDDLLRYRLVADKLILDKPMLLLDTRQSSRKKNPDDVIANLTQQLRPSLAIKKLSIHDAAITLITNQKNNGRLSIEDLNTEIDAKHLLNAKSVLDMIGSATTLSSSDFRVTGPNINLLVHSFFLNETKTGVRFQHVEGNIGEGLNLRLNDVTLDNPTSRVDVAHLQEIPIDHLTVGSGNIDLDLNQKRNSEREKTLAFRLANINTGTLQIKVQKAGKTILLNDATLHAKDVYAANKTVSWSSLNMLTGKSSLQTPQISLQADAVQVEEPGMVSLSGLTFNAPGKSVLKKLLVPSVSFESNVTATAQIQPSTERLIIRRPEIEIETGDPGGLTNETKWKLPGFYAKQIDIIDPALHFRSGDNTFAVDNGTIHLREVQTTDDNTLTAALFKSFLNAPVITSADDHYAPEQVNLTATQLKYDATTRKWQANIDTALLIRMDMNAGASKKIQISKASAGISNFAYKSTDTLSAAQVFLKAKWWANAQVVSMPSRFHHLNIYHPFASAKTELSFDSLTWIPAISRDSFWHSFPFEKDYMTLKMGQTKMHDWQLSRPGKNLQLTLQTLNADLVKLITDRDKTRGPDSISYRPLLANSLAKIPIEFAIDTVRFTNSNVLHHVVSEKTKKEGTISFDAMNGFVYNLKNYNIRDADTLRFKVSSKLMNQGDLQVGFRQSYTDSLQGFALRAKMGRMDLTHLNKLLMPLLSIRIDRGVADSMMLSVGANDYVAYGSMDMRFRGLSVWLLKNGERKYFMSSFFNWLINAVIPSDDNAKKNTIFHERLRNKSVYNFWGKIAINGLLANIGIKRDKKQIRKYNKAVKRGDVPAVGDETL